MDLEWNPVQVKYREEFRLFAEQEIEPGALRRDVEGSFDHSLWLKLARKGFWNLLIPESYGGFGGTIWDFIASFDGLACGTTDFGFLLSVIAHAGLIHLLVQHGNEKQCELYLPLLGNDWVGSTAATEATGGSRLADIRSVAVANPTGYLLNGEKVHITNAPVANLFMVAGRIPLLGRYDITLFLVEREKSGVSIGPPEDLMGQRSSPTGSITLCNVELPRSSVIGEAGNGLQILYEMLVLDRTLYGFAAAGLLDSMINRALDWAETRVAFGTRIREHEYIQEKIVDMKLTSEASRLLAYSALASGGKGTQAVMRAALTKLAASEGIVRGAVEFIQVFGHRGYEKKYGIERLLRDAVALRIAGGTTEMQKKVVFNCLTEENLLRQRRTPPSQEPVLARA